MFESKFDHWDYVSVIRQERFKLLLEKTLVSEI